MNVDTPNTALVMLVEFCECYGLNDNQKELISKIVRCAYHEGKFDGIRQSFNTKSVDNE